MPTEWPMPEEPDYHADTVLMQQADHKPEWWGPLIASLRSQLDLIKCCSDDLTEAERRIEILEAEVVRLKRKDT